MSRKAGEELSFLSTPQQPPVGLTIRDRLGWVQRARALASAGTMGVPKPSGAHQGSPARGRMATARWTRPHPLRCRKLSLDLFQRIRSGISGMERCRHDRTASIWHVDDKHSSQEEQAMSISMPALANQHGGS